MHRFFVLDAPLATGLRVDLEAQAHQLRQVLRASVGDSILLLDGDGHAYLAEIIELTHQRAAARILEAAYAASEPAIPVTLYQAALKGDRMEWVLQKATELGVARFVPVISARTITRPAETIVRKYPRWQAIVREAAEQCGRSRLPALLPPQSWIEVTRQGEGLRVLAWESIAGGKSLLAVVQTALAQTPAPTAISLLIGPEGGLTGGEVTMATQAGWSSVSLGPRTLRAETAAIVATALVMAAAGELGETTQFAHPAPGRV